MTADKEKVVIIDFGGQYTQLIARRVRELKVYSEIVPFTASLDEVKKMEPSALIFSGGAASVYGEGAPSYDPAVYNLGIPILGICYGMQLMAKQLGGIVTPAERAEYGKISLHLKGQSPLFAGLERQNSCWMSHSDRVEQQPPGFDLLATTDNAPVAAMGDDKRKIYAVQFHPEVSHTPDGQIILKNFLFLVCGLEGKWTMKNFIEETVETIRQQVGEGEQAICGLSGGIDSSVAALLVHKAIGNRLSCIFVDHGLLRQGEAEEVQKVFRSEFNIPLVSVDAGAEFLSLLQGVTDPEQKRKVIGNHFIRVFEREAAKLGRVDYLVQGTLYTDVIESGTATAATIKSHHNVGGLPEEMQLKLIEPLKELFKDEVRRVGEELGLPEEIIWRHPFPGPGLAVRVLGEVTEEKLSILRAADSIIIEEIKRAGLYREIWQAFAVLPGIRTVGVMGDRRTYFHTVALRAITSEDGMTADWYRFPYQVLERISSRVVNEVPQVNRLVYDLTSKPPSTVEWE